jgi:proteasome activator subunit 4
VSNPFVRCTYDNRVTGLNMVHPLVQLLDNEPFEVLRPILEELLADIQPDKQRGAAELLAGLLGGN